MEQAWHKAWLSSYNNVGLAQTTVWLLRLSFCQPFNGHKWQGVVAWMALACVMSGTCKIIY